ncbi:MAG: hypothetical protein JWM88_1214 [Verrucomicrobia bacterium]|nr:hypothetical protein [Verrucomicrobiota bacterium]
MKSLRFGFTLMALFASAIASFATIGATYQMQLGNPSSATTTTNHDHYLIQREQYAMDYSDTNGEPNWVSWDLTSGDVGSSGRSLFIQDTTLPAGFYQVLITDYSGSGYDRGHMCPSADRTVTVADNQVLFYMSNMIPQAPDNNQGVWANFESYCRTLAAAGNEVLITSGPSGFNGSRLPSSAAAIPGYVWKIVVVVPLGSGMATDRITASTRVIAIKIPNVAGVRSDPWQNYITTVAQIEADTGFTFFTTLPSAVANALRHVLDGETASGVPSIGTQPVTTTTVVGGSASFTVAASGTAPFSYQWFKDDVLIDGAVGATLAIGSVQASDAGTYDVVVSNASGSVTSHGASLIVAGIPPSIAEQPASITVAAGANVSLTVAVTGSPALTYQWRKEGLALPGANSSALVLLNAQSATAGTYDVVVSNSVNSVTSAIATVVVNPAGPAISVQPAAVTAPVNGTATFNVTAGGTAPLSYQWRRNTTDIVGATAATLTLAGVSATTAGSYDVVVTNPISSVTSSAAVLTVTAAVPSAVYWNFTTPAPASGLPADVTGGALTQGNNNGTTQVFTTTSASGTYVGVSGGNNAGAAARIGPLNPPAGGSAYFEFTLTPDAGKSLQAFAISFGSRSTATGPQAFAVFSSLDGYVTPVASGSLAANSVWTLYSPAMTAVTGTDGAPVTFRIFGYGGAGSPTAGTANWRIDDLKLTIATLATPVTGVAPTFTSTIPAAGAVEIPASSSISLTFSAPVTVAGQWFSITSAATGTVAATVTGGPSSFTVTPPISFAANDLITVTVFATQVVDKATGTAHLAANQTFSFTTAASSAPVPPTVIGQPASQSAIVGGTVSFAVAPSGTAPFTYQWRRNTVPVTGNATASTATLTLAGVTLAQQGSYDCVVANIAGNTISSAATLNVTALPPTLTAQPLNQTVTAGGSATFTVGVGGTAPFIYQWSRDGAPLTDGAGVSGASTGTLVISPAMPDDAGTYSVIVGNSVTSVTSNSAVLAVGTSPAGTILWNFTTATPSSGLPADVSGGAVSQGNNNGTTTMLTAVSASSGYADFSGASNAGAAARVGALNRGANGSAYFEFTLTPAPATRLVTSALGFGSRSTGTGPQAFALYTSVDGFTAPIATGTLANNSAWSLQSPAFAPLTGGSGAPVTFRLYGYNGAGGASANTANWRIDDLSLTVRTLATPPAITTTVPGAAASGIPISSPITINFNQPVKPVGSWVSVTSAANGPVAVTITGGPGSFTLTPAAPLAYNDVVTVMITGAQVSDLGTGVFAMDSDYAFSFGTSLPPAPVIVASPAAASVTVGDSVSLAVSVDSPVPVTYQWRKGGVAIGDNASALTSLLSLGAVTTADAGSYDCVVTSLGGTATSSAATLTVRKATVGLSFGEIEFVYDGAAKGVTVTAARSDLNITVAYSGGAIPVNAGSYDVAATIVDANYEGTLNGTLVIHPAPVSVVLGNLHQVYDGSGKSISAVSLPSGLPVAVVYSTGNSLPVNAGSYPVSANVTDPNHVGSASGNLVISPAAAAVAVSNLRQAYTGTPKAVSVAVSPADLVYVVTYGGSTEAPTLPGSYPVTVALADPNYSGSAEAMLNITVTALVNLPSTIGGNLDGSMQVLSGESFSVDGNATISGDLLLPGTATVSRNGHGAYGALVDGAGSATPSNYTVNLNGNALVGRVLRRVNPIAMPAAVPPSAPTGTRALTLNHAGDAVGDFTTVRDLTLGGNSGIMSVPEGAYGALAANSGGFVLGQAGAAAPSVYSFQSMDLGGNSVLHVAGPVIIRVAGSVNLNGALGNAAHPEWLTLEVSGSEVTLNGNAALDGSVVAPAAAITVNGKSVIRGDVSCDRLVIGANSALEMP